MCYCHCLRSDRIYVLFSEVFCSKEYAEYINIPLVFTVNKKKEMRSQILVGRGRFNIRTAFPLLCYRTQDYWWQIPVEYRWIPSAQVELIIILSVFVCGATAPSGARASSFPRFLDHTQRRTTFGRTPLDEWLSRRRDLYLTTHNTHNRQTSKSPVGFEPTVPTDNQPQGLDRVAAGAGIVTVGTVKT